MASKKMKTSTAYEGHGENSTPPSPKKGTYYAIGTFLDAGAMTTTYPKGISVNVKSGQLGSGTTD